MVEQELQRLKGNCEFYDHDLFIVNYMISLDEKKELFLEKIKHVLIVIDENSKNFDLVNWSKVLPQIFLSKFAPNDSSSNKNEYFRQWQSLTLEEKLNFANNASWTLDGWLYYMEPEKREWFWLCDKTIDDKNVVIKLLVYGHPYPDGAFKWLCKACGSLNIKELDVDY